MTSTIGFAARHRYAGALLLVAASALFWLMGPMAGQSRHEAFGSQPGHTRLGAAAVRPVAWMAKGGAEDDEDKRPFTSRQPAFSLEGGEWINTAGPIDLKKLRGKFVILDFWTYCCINCMHILPNLKKLEHAYPNEIVVIGVHSAKFSTEQDSKNIREAIERYEIEHPVVNDANHEIWERYRVQSWPTLMVIDPEGNLVAANSGETDFATLDDFFKRVMPYYRKKGLLKPDVPVPTGLAAGHKLADAPLRYPGKLLADEKGDRLFIADSNHNRIVVARLDGTLVETIGSGQVGSHDGNFSNSSFNHPQGMALVGDVLYIADTENHLLRKADLKHKRVERIAGTGQQGHGWYDPRQLLGQTDEPLPKNRLSGPPLKTALNSPWALWVHGHELYIAMAGPHQIWQMSLTKHEIGLFAGNGREDIVDGTRPLQCSFAQPSGLSSDGKSLFVADSEGSSIRAIAFDPGTEVSTIIGTSWVEGGGRLFLFGDVDGQGRKVRLQHALDVLYHDKLLYVADTYNNKIKVIDPAQATCRTLAGTGEPGLADAPPQFDEPAGLAYAQGKLYVADTNNHAIRTIDLAHDNKVATLTIEGLAPPEPPKAEARSPFAGVTPVELPAATVKPQDGKVRLDVVIELPAGYKVNPQAPLRYQVDSADASGPIDPAALGKLTSAEPGKKFSIELPLKQPSGRQQVSVSLAVYYCQTGSEGVCKAASAVRTFPLELSADAKQTAATLDFKIE